jgi:hypothetical protein
MRDAYRILPGDVDIPSKNSLLPWDDEKETYHQLASVIHQCIKEECAKLEFK